MILKVILILLYFSHIKRYDIEQLMIYKTFSP